MRRNGQRAGSSRRVGVIGALAVTAGAVAVAAAALAASPAGSVRQVRGKDGCYTADGSSAAGANTCHEIRGGDGSTTLAISPDGESAYLVGYGSSGPPPVVPVLSVFRRNSSDGTLHQLAGKKGCFSRDGSSEEGPNTCTDARNLDSGDATSIAISRDGKFLYVASEYTPMGVPIGGVAIFRRSLKTGALHQLAGKSGCVSATGASEDGPGTCTKAREADDTSNLQITPDQKYLYASNYDSPPHSGIAIFKRSAKTGRLHQVKGKNGCITDDGTTGQSGTKVVCRKSPNLYDPWDVATPDNRFAYVPANGDTPSTDLVQAFERNAKGGLVPMSGRRGCVSDDGTSPGGPCVDGRGLYDAERAVLSKNKRFIYTNSYAAPSPVAVLNRSRKTGKLSQRRGPAACISVDGTSGDTTDTCRDGRALSGGYAGTLTPDGRTLYFAEYGTGGNNGNGMVIFHVSRKTGAFHQLAGTAGCVTFDGSSEDGAGTCGTGRAIEGAYQVALGSRARDVYVSAYGGNGVALFHTPR